MTKMNKSLAPPTRTNFTIVDRLEPGAVLAILVFFDRIIPLAALSMKGDSLNSVRPST
jgi:hypothetical protein